MSSNGYGAGRPAFQTSLLPPQPYTSSSSAGPSSRRDQYGGPSDYLPAISVATGYTVPSSAASIAGYRTHPTMINDYQSSTSSTSNLHHAYARDRPYVPRVPRLPVPRVDEGVTGLAALVSASEATPSLPVARAYHTLPSLASSSSRSEASRTIPQQNPYASQLQSAQTLPIPSIRANFTSTTMTNPTETSGDDSSYPIAPSPAYDPVAFERIIGLSSDDEVVRAQRQGISPAMLMKRESRLQALVKATEPGQLEAWQTEQVPSTSSSSKKRKVMIEEPEQEVDSGPTDAPTPRSLASSSRGRGRGGAVRVRVRKPRPKKGEPGWISRSKRAEEAEKDAEGAVDDVEDSSSGPFNSLTAHLAAYSQRDKALQREEAGYSRIPDLRPEEILIRRQQEVEARAQAMLPAENTAGMDIDLSGFGDIDAEIDEQADYEAQRQARIAHNNRIMAALGLGPVEEAAEPRVQERPVGPRARGRPAKPKRRKEPQYSPDGTTTDPPLAGRQRLAYVDVPHVFRSRRVQTLFRYTEIPAVPENPTVTESEESDLEVVEIAPVMRPKVPYSQLMGDHCHQCRRKSDKPKMSCRNKACGLKYCVTCVQRYNFSFEEYSRTFICPRCQGYCNCSACLRSSGLLKLLKLDENQDKLRMSLHAAKSAPNVQVYLEIMGAPKAPPMPLQELHRIRFINKEEDIITPEIPDDILSELMSRRLKKTTKTKKNKKQTVEPVEIAQPQPAESSDLSDEETAAYYDPQYGYQAAESRRPVSDANYQYAIANAWSVYQT